MPDRTIMIVEDDKDLRDMLELTLSSQGYTIVTATNGMEALEKLHGPETPALILLDLMMPLLNGFDFCHARRMDPKLKQIPVVVLSGASNFRQWETILKADGYLSKPLRIERLLEMVDELCE